jgi:hypothetical protein
VAELIDGENDVTLPPPLTRAVPVEVVYQSIVQLPGAVALNVTVPDPQRELLLGLVGSPGMVFIVAATAVRVADTQPVVVFRACA